MKLKFLPILGIAFITACTASAAREDYKVSVAVPQSTNGQTAFLVDYDNGEKIDSVMVENGKAVFTGSVEQPLIARVVVNGERYGNLVLEQGDITVKRDGTVSGGALNATMDKAAKGLNGFQAKAAALPQDSTYPARMNKLVDEYNAYIDSVVAANVSNPVGYRFFLEQAYEYDLPTLRKALEKYPQMKKYTRTAKLISALEQKEKTQPGNKFIDFTIAVNDSVSQSLSDYVGNGRYTLVDFWASWCGPCIRETKVLKQIREEFKDKNLDILGVAVWDEPAATEAAIKRHQLPWPQIINAQSVPTDLYGISGIPCIILFGPDGTIISRDKQGEELIQAVRSALDSSTTPAE